MHGNSKNTIDKSIEVDKKNRECASKYSEDET